MPWEKRSGGGSYYTRSRRVGGRKVRIYVGAGVAGQVAAAEDAERRAVREASLQANRAERARRDSVDGPVRQLFQLTSMLTSAVLVAAGFMLHHGGEWRVARGYRKACTRARRT